MALGAKFLSMMAGLLENDNDNGIIYVLPFC